MSETVFDHIASDYEAIHNRSLPPGVKSDDFVRQKATLVCRWLLENDRGDQVRYLDFGCGNGRLFRYLLDAPALQPMLSAGRLQLYGFDTSTASLAEAAALTSESNAVTLAESLDALPADNSFDLIISCNVFHHIPPAERPAAIGHLAQRLRPDGRLVLWEHNPFNPATRLLVRLCPFDGDARLLTLASARRLCAGASLHPLHHQYVNILPPGLHRFPLIAAGEKLLAGWPFGSQYWLMCGRHE